MADQNVSKSYKLMQMITGNSSVVAATRGSCFRKSSIRRTPQNIEKAYKAISMVKQLRQQRRFQNLVSCNSLKNCGYTSSKSIDEG